MATKEVANSLWIGEKLLPQNIISIKSFLQNGFDYNLYVYDDVKNIPSEVNVLDANDILPESRIWVYEIEDLDDELVKRIKLEECEKLNSKFILKRIKKYMGKIHPDVELTKRQILNECEKHTDDYVTERIKEFQPLTLKTEDHEDLYEQLKWREDLEQSQLHTSEFIEENLKFYKGRGVEIASPTEELEHRLKLEECEKFDTDYISRETARLKDEYLIRDPIEELKHRMNLAFFEENVKDKEKIANKDTFWDMISVHGHENMDLIKTELNKVGEGY